MSKVTVNTPKTPVTEGSNGVAAATLPNVCKMPGPPAPFVPTPLPNIGKSGTNPKNYSKSVTIEGKKVAITGATFGSMGDVASKGTGGGLLSSNVEGPTSFVGPGSMDVKIEGKNVQLLGDPMLNNCGPGGSPANAATLMGLIQKNDLVTAITGEEGCPLCPEKHGPLEETYDTKQDASTLASEVQKMVNEVNIVNGKKKKRHLSTMLGIVHCKCGEVYADHSSATLLEFCEIVRNLGWNAPESKLSIDATLEVRFSAQTPTQKRVYEALQKISGGSPEVDLRWEEAEELSRDSYENKGSGKPAAYPPGLCAAQKTIPLALDGEVSPSGLTLTEQWFHCKEKETDSPIEFEKPAGNKLTEHFAHGDTVPPCETCKIIIPLMLCTKDKVDTCQHKNKTIKHS